MDPGGYTRSSLLNSNPGFILSRCAAMAWGKPTPPNPTPPIPPGTGPPAIPGWPTPGPPSRLPPYKKPKMAAAVAASAGRWCGCPKA